MAVYTDVSEEQLALFLARYDAGRLLSYKGIAEGVENSNFIVRTEAGVFILTLYEKRTAPEDLPFFLGLMMHLEAKGISCPKPIADRHGKILGQIAGRPAALVSFLDGMWMRRPRVEHCAELGAALAHMHLAGLDFAGARSNALSLDAWEPLFARSESRADDVHLGLAKEIGGELAALVRDWPHGLPNGVIHADLFPDNVFFLGERISGLIDFYFACRDILAYDVAICLNAWCFEPDHAFNVTKARALLDAYRRVRPFTPGEFEVLPILARGAAMRFFLTRLYDWLNVPPNALVKPKDPLEYLKKLRFHRNLASAGDYGLDQ